MFGSAGVSSEYSGFDPVTMKDIGSHGRPTRRGSKYQEFSPQKELSPEEQKKLLAAAGCGICAGNFVSAAFSIATLVLTIKVLVGASVSVSGYGACFMCSGLIGGMVAVFTLCGLKGRIDASRGKMLLALNGIFTVFSIVMPSLALGGVIPIKTLAYAYGGMFVFSLIAQGSLQAAKKAKS